MYCTYKLYILPLNLAIKKKQINNTKADIRQLLRITQLQSDIYTDTVKRCEVSKSSEKRCEISQEMAVTVVTVDY